MDGNGYKVLKEIRMDVSDGRKSAMASILEVPDQAAFFRAYRHRLEVHCPSIIDDSRAYR